MGHNTGGKLHTVRRVFDSTLDSVDEAEALAVDTAREAGFEEGELYGIGTAVRECMVNAVTHGNRYSSHKKVTVSVSRNSKQLTVKIADQGEGFDLAALPDPLADENLLSSSGRGIFLARAFVDDFQVHRIEPSGTEVVLVKNLEQGADLQID